MQSHLKSAVAIVASCAMLAARTAWADAQSGLQPPQHSPAITFARCKGLKTIDVVNSTDTSTTSSIDYTDVPGAFVHFVTRKPGCVLVTFSAPASAPQTFIFVQMVVDGATGCLPFTNGVANVFAGESTEDEYANSMTYICSDVPSGKHVVRTQWKVNNPHLSRFDGFTMTVAHR